MVKYTRKMKRYYKRRGNRKNYQFKSSGLKNMFTKRKIEYDYSIQLNNGVPVFTTTFNSANLLEDISNTQPEWASLFQSFRYYRIRGVSVEWVPKQIDITPFCAMVFPTDINPSIALTAITADNRLQCDGVIGRRQVKYYDFQGASFQSNRGYVNCGPIWNLTDRFDATVFKIMLVLGAQLGSTAPAGTIIGAMRIKLYVDFCYANIA